MKNYDKNKELSCLKYWNVNNLYGWAMSQKLPVNDFKWVEGISEFDESFIKNYNKNNDVGCFLKFISNTLTMIYHFHLREWRLKKSKSMLLIYIVKLNML